MIGKIGFCLRSPTQLEASVRQFVLAVVSVMAFSASVCMTDSAMAQSQPAIPSQQSIPPQTPAQVSTQISTQTRTEAPQGFDSAILQQIQQAAQQLNYVGVFAYQEGGAIESSRITHAFDGTHEIEKLELLDGPARECLRRNQEVQCLIPSEQRIELEKQTGARFPGLLMSNAQFVDTNYIVQPLPEPMRIAGRACQLIDVVPRDRARYGYRLCVDTQSKLLLKAQTVNTHGQVIEQVAFTQIAIVTNISPAMLEPSWPMAGWAVHESAQKAVNLQDLGWRMVPPAGFRATSQTEQLFAENKHVHQMVLSDGLATISIFIEPYLNARSDYKPLGAAQVGSVNLYGVKIANFWLTVLGEVPAYTLEKFAQSIQYVPNTASK